MAAQGDLDAGLPQPFGVGLALVAQRVKAGGGDVGGWKTAEVIGLEDGDAWIAAVGPQRQVPVLEVVHVAAGEEEALAKKVPRMAIPGCSR